MSHAFLLSLEVEAAAERNANLSKQLQQLQSDLTMSAIIQSKNLVSIGTQTALWAPCEKGDLVVTLDDIAFELAEMGSLLQTSDDAFTIPPRRLSRGSDVTAVELCHYSLHQLRRLRSSLSTKIEGYEIFIRDLKDSLLQKIKQEETKPSCNDLSALCEIQVKALEAKIAVHEENAERNYNEQEALKNKLLAAEMSCISLQKRIEELMDVAEQKENQIKELETRNAKLFSALSNLETLPPFTGRRLFTAENEPYCKVTKSPMTYALPLPTVADSWNKCGHSNLKRQGKPQVLLDCLGLHSLNAPNDLCASPNEVVEFYSHQ